MLSDSGGLRCGHNLDICSGTDLDRFQSPAISITCSLSYTGNVTPVLQFIKYGHLVSYNVTSSKNKATFPEPRSSTAVLTMLPAALLQLSPFSCRTVLFRENSTYHHDVSFNSSLCMLTQLCFRRDSLNLSMSFVTYFGCACIHIVV